ncbi:hypothetical protein L6452_21318 [Arctium lappa]|uniref:Uncharacterized protein n=1 Tax=Arctium lappa TaxID=4217 RepID=A0ACB9BEB5_ARCLA|nr:hypothetical protein L6452_21318 [Arctium lappa]
MAERISNHQIFVSSRLKVSDRHSYRVSASIRIRQFERATIVSRNAATSTSSSSASRLRPRFLPPFNAIF